MNFTKEKNQRSCGVGDTKRGLGDELGRVIVNGQNRVEEWDSYDLRSLKSGTRRRETSG